MQFLLKEKSLGFSKRSTRSHDVKCLQTCNPFHLLMLVVFICKGYYFNKSIVCLSACICVFLLENKHVYCGGFYVFSLLLRFVGHYLINHNNIVVMVLQEHFYRQMCSSICRHLVNIYAAIEPYNYKTNNY